MKEYTAENPKSSKTMSIIYIVGMVLCVVLVVTLVLISAKRIQQNKELKKKEQEIVEKYQELAKENENLKDEDYAQVYFDGENLYIPSKDIVIEYQP